MSKNTGPQRCLTKPQQPPTIELDGARLRPLRAADAAALYAYLRDPVVTELTSYPVFLGTNGRSNDRAVSKPLGPCVSWATARLLHLRSAAFGLGSGTTTLGANETRR